MQLLSVYSYTMSFAEFMAGNGSDKLWIVPASKSRAHALITKNLDKEGKSSEGNEVILVLRTLAIQSPEWSLMVEHARQTPPNSFLVQSLTLLASFPWWARCSGC